MGKTGGFHICDQFAIGALEQLFAFDSYAKGIVKVAQGCEERATLGQPSPIPTTLKGLFIRGAVLA